MSSLERTEHGGDGRPSPEAPAGVRDALNEVLGESKQLAANHLELRMLEIRGLVEGYAKRTSAACVAMLFAAMGLVCLTAAAILALAHNGMSQEGACASVGAGALVVTVLLSWRAAKPVQLNYERKETK